LDDSPARIEYTRNLFGTVSPRGKYFISPERAIGYINRVKTDPINSRQLYQSQTDLGPG
jgi:hypothetical protein